MRKTAGPREGRGKEKGERSLIYTVTLNPAIDCVTELDALAAGRIHRARRQEIQCGGKGINVSVLLGRLGVENTALGFIAGFTGDALESGLCRMGVRTDFTRLQSGMTRVNIKLRDGRETDVNAPGPVPDAAARAALAARLAALGAGDTVVFAGSLPRGMDEDTYADLSAPLAGRGVRVVVDAAGGALRRTLPLSPFLIKPNREELSGLFGRALTGRAEIEDCARCLRDEGARNVLVSLAEEGALLIDETGRARFQAAPRGAARNSVGAGDSMVAGFLAGLARTGDTGQALRWGVAAGSATAFSVGLAEAKAIERALASLPQ